MLSPRPAQKDAAVAAKTSTPAKGAPSDDTRVKGITPLNTPASVLHALPCTNDVAQTVLAGRAAIRAILDGKDDRLVCR